ncbi:hypothetical protein [Vannielia litorea]|uniref:hypothetical protein n=1 Tax=Vannielia litorea TaxID=1217970 RepID=UPI00158818CA|nr:hypothetical protein [Vannielia litorea]
MNAARLINMALRMLMRTRRRNANGGGGKGANANGRKLRSALRIGRIFGRF